MVFSPETFAYLCWRRVAFQSQLVAAERSTLKGKHAKGLSDTERETKLTHYSTWEREKCGSIFTAGNKNRRTG